MINLNFLKKNLIKIPINYINNKKNSFTNLKMYI